MQLKELQDNLDMLLAQWNVANRLMSESKRLKHLARLESWIDSVSAKIDELSAQAEKAG